MDKYLSDKLKAISFILMVMVVFLHSYNIKINYNGNLAEIGQGFNSFIQEAISNGFTFTAVPLFFIISGYLFFLNIKDGSLKEFNNKYKKRIRTLLLPYLFWSLSGLLFVFVLQSIPISKPFFHNELIIQYSLSKFLNTLFINPVPYQLWFIRDLMILILFTPILYKLLRSLKEYLLIVFLITWFFQFDYIIFSYEALFFFTIGAFLGIKKLNLQHFQLNNRYLLFLVMWVGLVLFKTSLSYISYDNEWLIRFLHKSSILIGIQALWFSYDNFFGTKDISKTKFYYLLPFSFFLYAFHEPILTIYKKIFYYLLGQSELNSLIIYLLAPLITIFTSIVLGYYLKKYLPKFYFLMTGGR